MTSPHLLSYIDPGTGSMLFSLLVGLFGAGYFVARGLVARARFALDGGRSKKSGERVPVLIFSDDRRYWSTFKPICDELERRGVRAAYWTASPDDPALSEAYEHVSCEFIGEGNRAFARLNVAAADVLLSTTPGLQVYQWRRSKDVGWYVHVMHSVDTAAGYRMFGLDFYDAVLLTGEFQAGEVRELERLRGLPEKELVVVGCPYLDAMAERLASEPVAPESDRGRRTVLLAPSWGPSSLLSAHGEGIIDALLGAGWDVILRPHPQSWRSEAGLMARLRESHPDSDRLRWDLDPDNFASLSAADAMVSDFSGVVYDFALVFDKPVVYAEGQFDPAQYDAAWLEAPLRKFGHYPLMGTPMQGGSADVGEVLSRAAEGASKEGRATVRDEAWQNRGRATAAVVDYLSGVLSRSGAGAASASCPSGSGARAVGQNVLGPVEGGR